MRKECSAATEAVESVTTKKIIIKVISCYVKDGDQLEQKIKVINM